MMLAIVITNVIAWSNANINDSFLKVWLLTYNLIQVVACLGGIAQFVSDKLKARAAQKVEMQEKAEKNVAQVIPDKSENEEDKNEKSENA